MGTDGGVVLSLQRKDGDARYQAELLQESTPEKVFDQRWAAALLEQVLTRPCST